MYFDYLISQCNNVIEHEINTKSDAYDKKTEKDNIPVTISECFIPIQRIRREKKFSQEYQDVITRLKCQFAAWKKCRGDGNCYYRSVISTYLIKIFHFSKDSSKIEKLISDIQKAASSNYYSEFRNYISYFYNVIYNLFQKRQSNLIETFIDIHKYLQDKEFDISSIVIARVISHMALLDHKDEYINFFPDEEFNILKINILTLGREAESQELMLLPRGLDIEVTQINIFDDKYLINYYPVQDLTNSKIKVSIICKSRGHYDCLYSKQEAEDESYDLKKRVYVYPYFPGSNGN